MKIACASEMRHMDEEAINQYGIPGVVLMENAALSVVQEIMDYYNSKQKEEVIIFCGTGNNGGDGFAIARHLQVNDIPVQVLLIGKSEVIKGDAKINYDICLKLGIQINQITNRVEMNKVIERTNLSSHSILVDALFGTGLARPIEGYRSEVIEWINSQQSYVIAVDIPSGIEADTGKVLGCAIQADTTVTFGLYKPGLLLYPGAYYSGIVRLADISMPIALRKNNNLAGNVLLRSELKNKLPQRMPWSNKGSYGKVAIIAGSKDMSGAAILSGKSAYRVGAGLVKLIIPKSIKNVIQASLYEGVCVSYEDGDGKLTEADCYKIEKAIEGVDAIVIGPGLSTEKLSYELLELTLAKASVPIIIDADGLNLIAQHDIDVSTYKGDIVMTPHMGEMSRLTGKSIEKLKDQFIDQGRAYAKTNNVILVLKDARSLIVNEVGEYYINCVGNHGMSTAGSGDVLTGIIGGLVAQGLGAFTGAYLGCYVHGLAGDLAAQEKGTTSLVASDLYKYTTKMEEFK